MSDNTRGACVDVERARVTAWKSYVDAMHFHEVAIRDPWGAERAYQDLCKEILDCLGPPEGVRVMEVRHGT